VHLVTRLNVGGIARWLDAARGVVDLLVHGRVESPEVEARWDGARVRIDGLARAVRPFDDLRAARALHRLLREVQPRLLHTHASKAGALGRVVAGRLSIPCVHTFHGHVLDGYFPAPATRVVVGIERRLARSARLTATGPDTAADLQRRLGVEVEVLAPGVRLPEPSADARDRWRARWGHRGLVALAVGRDAAVKDHGRFVRAARSAGYLPVVAGAGRVEGALALGTVDRIEDVYAACDVVVGASRAEGTPYALLEAGWAGRPVVARPVGDVAWVVGDGGLVTEDLEGALRRLADPLLRAELGARGAAHVRARFPFDAVAPRLRELYDRVARG